MYIRTTGMLLATVLVCSTLQATAAGAPLPCTPANTEVAVRRLQAKVHQMPLYTSWTQPQCLQWVPEHCDRIKVDITLREIHSPACGGDPNTGPVVELFRVFRKSGQVRWYKLADDEYTDFARAHIQQKR